MSHGVPWQILICRHNSQSVPQRGEHLVFSWQLNQASSLCWVDSLHMRMKKLFMWYLISPKKPALQDKRSAWENIRDNYVGNLNSQEFGRIGYIRNMVQSRSLGQRLGRHWDGSVTASQIGLGWYAHNAT